MVDESVNVRLHTCLAVRQTFSDKLAEAPGRSSLNRVADCRVSGEPLLYNYHSILRLISI